MVRWIAVARNCLPSWSGEQGILTQKVAALRGFESSYRENMRGYLSRHLESLEQNLPEPLDVPELAERSRTPRLDALAAQDRLA